MKARVHVTLKEGVLDPEGTAIGRALAALGFEGVGEVRVGKVFELELEETDRHAAETTAARMCERLLANPVIETYTIDIED